MTIQREPAPRPKAPEAGNINHPKARKLAMRVTKECELALQKAIAHKADPRTYPLPQDPRSVERLLVARLERLSPEQLRRVAGRVMPQVKADKATRERSYGDLAAIDLHKDASVFEQSARLTLPKELRLERDDVEALTRHGAGNGHAHSGAGRPSGGSPGPRPAADRPSGSSPAIAPLGNLELRIHSVRCVDDTGEIGNDEISCGGASVYNADVRKVSPFAVGDFRDGDVKTYSPPRRFVSFDLRDGTPFPRSYYATVALAETDGGGFMDFLNTLLDKIDDRVTALLSAAAGAAVGTAIGTAIPGIGNLVGAVVGAAVGALIGLLKTVAEDDILGAETVSVDMASPSHRFGGNTESPQGVKKFDGHHSSYEVRYSWRLYS